MSEINSKACTKCGEIKSLDMFYRCGPDGSRHRGDCKACVLKRCRERYKKNPFPAKARSALRNRMKAEKRRAERAATFDPYHKRCNSCGETKGLLDFYRKRSVCKACVCAARRAAYAFKPELRARLSEAHRESYLRNRERRLEANKAYRERKAELIRRRRRAHYEKNRDTIIERYQNYKKRNKHVVDAYQKRYRRTNAARRAMSARQRDAIRASAQPGWLSDIDLRKIKRVYERSAELSASTGVAHHVDHIVPLRGENVCGLHVPWNLQVLTASENMRKGNRMVEI